MSVAPAFDEPADRSASELVPELEKVFRSALNVTVPSADADLIDSGLIDSLALVELLFAIEQRFAVDLALEELDVESFRTIDRLAGVIAQAQDAARRHGS